MMKYITQPFKKLGAMVAQSSNALAYSIIAVVAIIGPLFLLPIQVLNLTASKGYFAALCGIIALLVGGITVLKRGSLSVPRNGIFMVLGGLVVALLLGAIFSPSFTMASLGYGFETTTWLFMIVFAVMVLFAYKTIKAYDRIGLIYGGLLVAFIITAIIHIIRFIFGPATANLWVLGNSTATLVGTWADLGMFSGLILVIAMITLQLVGLVRFAKWLVASVAAIAAVFLLAMNMYTVWMVIGFISLLIMLYLFAFAYWDARSQTYKKEKRVPWYVFTLFGLSLVGMFFGGFINNLFSSYQNIAWNDIRPSVTTTFQVAQKSLGHNFVTGYGPNSFELGWALAKPAALSGSSFSDTGFSLGYSYITTQMANNGILGMILWVLLLGVIIFSILKRMSKGFETALERYFVTSLAASIFFLMLMSLVSIPGSYLLLIWAIMIGAFYGVFASTHELHFSFIKDPRASFFGILTVTALIVGTLIGGYVITRKIVSFVHDTKGLILLGTNDYRGATTKIAKAIAYAPHDIFHVQLAQLALTDAGKVIATLNQNNREAVSAQAEQLLGIAVGNAKAATLRNPLSYKNWLLLGNAYRSAVALGVKDAYSLAESAYAEAEKRNPNDATMKLSYANLALANKDTATAMVHIKESIDLFPTRDAYLLRAQLHIQDQKWNDVVTALKQAVLLDQNNAALYVYLGVAYEKSGDMNNATQIYDLIKSRFADGAQAIEQIKKAFAVNPVVTQPTEDEITLPKDAKTPVAPKPKKE